MAGKNIILGITGGIAAYKTPMLVRLLKQADHEVQVVMSQGATEFVTALTLQTLSGQTVRGDVFDAQAESAMDHIDLAKWADQIIIAPATAHCIAQLAHGFAGDLLTTLCLATTAPIVLAPAMNVNMWDNVATQANVDILQQRQFGIIGPAQGEQACGDVGYGRMSEPEQIMQALFA
ncbi:MAG: phosphopantothenoylcysteine decarboxylase/phosphopantothenate--cysteine ligase [Saprospiraceae bacterium]|jgi:phosphopantothenoylcysteine decarboxylase/phosphopantothenate--cysteine ligase